MKNAQPLIMRVSTAIRPLSAALLAGAVDAVFPKRCKGCEEFLPFEAADGLCEGCWGSLRLVSSPYCPLCGCPYEYQGSTGNLCVECLLRAPPFVRARSWACYPRYGNSWHPLRRAVHRFKYGRKLSYGKVLGRLMADGCRRHLFRPDVIVPVPLHVARLRWRGFNQAVVLGQAVSRSWGVLLDPFALKKSRSTSPQTELSRNERSANVRGVFTMNPRRPVKGLHLLLVDDVYTSGATVKECSRVLLKAGARTVQVLTLGRTV